MPPLRSVRSCSPSASARTVTAHSLKAIGIEVKGETVGLSESCARSLYVATAASGRSGFYARYPESQNLPANRVFHPSAKRAEPTPLYLSLGWAGTNSAPPGCGDNSRLRRWYATWG